MLALEAAQIALKFGVTTVFDTWGPREFLIRAREEINSGRAMGARIFLAGNIIGWMAHSEDFLPKGTLLDEFPEHINQIWQGNVGAELVWEISRPSS